LAALLTTAFAIGIERVEPAAAGESPQVSAPARVDAGGSHSCIVLVSGKVKCWGRNDKGQLGNATTTNSATPVLVSGLNGVRAITTGASHSCALLVTGRVKCWGLNSSGQLGNGTTTNSAVPVLVSSLNGVLAITAGGAHSCALLVSGAVKCWGRNGSGQLGNGSTARSSTPATVALLTGLTPATAAKTITAGSSHTCASLANGRVMCWGFNANGQLGNGTTASSLNPVAVSALTRITSVTAGGSHSCAISGTSIVSCWGLNTSGQLGNGATTSSSTPVRVINLPGPRTVEAGVSHSCASLADGTLRCWGLNANGRLGDGSRTSKSTPVTVTNLGGLITGTLTVTAGGSHSCTISAVGTVSCWGRNANGQLGNGTTTSSSTPVPTASLGTPHGAVMVSGGPYHTCALLASGTVKCWGSNAEGALGNGTTADATTPVPVSNLTGVVAVTAGGNTTSTGYQNSCAVQATGAVWCWGDNLRGQLGTGQDRFALPFSSVPVHVSGLTNAVAVSTQAWHACAVLGNGTAKCWGTNAKGELGNGTLTQANSPVPVYDPTPSNPNALLTGVVSITTGLNHSCALLANGTVKCWGNNVNGYLGVPTIASSKTPVTVTGLSGVSAIVGADEHSCALLAAGGTAKCWGNSWGLGNPNNGRSFAATPVPVLGLSGATALSAGLLHSCALLAAGTVKCWGGGNSGQLGNGSTAASTIPVLPVTGTTGGTLTGVSSIAGGGFHSCAVLAVAGTVDCWGGNIAGELGNGTKTSSSLPVVVSGL
jgi:alpha-tubulin suppressor-like RCC1 family protein